MFGCYKALQPGGKVLRDRGFVLDEQVCQTFDDTGLSDVLDAEKCPPELDEQAFSTLKELDSAVSRVDQSASPGRLLKDPRVKKVREIAARALALVAERQT